MIELATHPDLIPTYEPHRLEALRSYQLLSVPGQQLFNDLVGIVAKLFGVPIALVSLVEAEEVVFAGNVGLPGLERVARPDSLCSVAILQDGVTVYENLLVRPCHLTNPDAAAALDLQFYAGQSLHSADGYPVGTLCVMDHAPRTFSAEESALLASLGDVAMVLLDLRVALTTDSALADGLRQRVDARIDQSLTRIDTLASLQQWESAPDTEAAQAYRRSSHEEATQVVRVLHAELRQALAGLHR
ncbi:MAG: GAF domain-containing protein [Janthinobacterium lividum]